MERNFPDIECTMIQGYPEAKFQSAEFWELPDETSIHLILIDDLSGEAGPSLEQMFRGKARHNRAMILWLSQDSSSEPKVVKNALRHASYFLLTKTTSPGILIADIARKVFTYSPKLLPMAYKQCMQEENPTGDRNFLIVDATYECEPGNTLRSGIMPGEIGKIYRPIA